MKMKSELTIKKTVSISRRISWSFIALFFLTGIISAITETYDLKWLEVIIPFLGGISLILFVISVIMPGIFILLRYPWLAHAWNRGINPFPTSDTPCEQLSSGQKLLTYLWALVILVFMLVTIIEVIIQ